jgi:hypothetical protein
MVDFWLFAMVHQRYLITRIPIHPSLTYRPGFPAVEIHAVINHGRYFQT